MDFVLVHDKHFEQTARIALALILPNSEYDAKKIHEGFYILCYIILPSSARTAEHTQCV
jgi:hypothetical protein